jgi:hypothetical protein
MRDVERAYFTYPVTDGLLEAVTIFDDGAHGAGLELVVNNSQFQSIPGDPAFRDLQHAASFRNLQHRLADRIFDWAQVHAVHLQAPPYYENVCALVSRSVAEQSTVFLPWGEDTTVIPLISAEDVARVAATLLASPGTPSQTVYPLVSETPTVKEPPGDEHNGQQDGEASRAKFKQSDIALRMRSPDQPVGRYNSRVSGGIVTHQDRRFRRMPVQPFFERLNLVRRVLPSFARRSIRRNNARHIPLRTHGVAQAAPDVIPGTTTARLLQVTCVNVGHYLRPFFLDVFLPPMPAMRLPRP